MPKSKTNQWKEVYEVSNSLIGEFDPMLSQVINLQEKIQRQVGEQKHLIKCDANLYEYIVENKDLELKETNYIITNRNIEERFKGNWSEFMNFARKNKRILLGLDRKLQFPYYYGRKRLSFFGSQEAMMANLTGDLELWLKNNFS